MIRANRALLQPVRAAHERYAGNRSPMNVERHCHLKHASSDLDRARTYEPCHSRAIPCGGPWMIVSSEIVAAIDKRHEHFLTLGPSRPLPESKGRRCYCAVAKERSPTGRFAGLRTRNQMA